MSILRIAGAALNQIPFDWQTNVNNIVNAISAAKENKVDILCLPELCITGYGCEDMFLSDWVWQEALNQLPRIIEETEGIFVSVGLPLKHKGILYNCSAVIANKKVLGIRVKQHLANDGVHYEPRWFTPWQKGVTENYNLFGEEVSIGDVVFTYKNIIIGMEICEDAWTGEQRPACHFAERGVQLIINPSASHFAFGKTKTRENLAIDASKNYNLVYLYANLLGNESGRMIFDGEIFISGPKQILGYNERFSFKDTNLLYKDIDFGNIDNHGADDLESENKFKVFTDAVALGLFDYLRKSHSKGFVLSLSGGADSSTCAVLVAEMVRRGIKELGVTNFLEKIGRADIHPLITSEDVTENIKVIMSNILTCAYQGTKNSSFKTFQAAKELARECGATFHHWLIDDEVDTYTRKVENALNRKLNWNDDDITLQNIQARSRSPIIWMLANIANALLITTSNRSEGDVGYATMDGDTSGSIAPIAGVDKHFIINWLVWAEKELGYKSLNFVNNLAPSAELRPQDQEQTDEKDLMPYWLIVEIEKLAIRDRKSPVEVFQSLQSKDYDIGAQTMKNYIHKFYTLWSRNQWKRERIAPSFHLDDLNVDPRTWCRFPILSSSFKKELADLRDY